MDRMIFMITAGILLGQLVWEISRMELGIGIMSFLSGIFCTMLVLSIGSVQLIRWLPKHLYPLRIQSPLQGINSGVLQKSGWLRISTVIVDRMELFNEPFDFPTHLIQVQSKVSQIECAINAKNFIRDRFKGIQPEEKKSVARNWRNVYAQLKFQNLILYSSRNQEHILLSINIPEATVKLVGDSDYHDDPILIKFDSARIYLYFPTSSEKEDWFCKLCRCKKLPNGFKKDRIMEFYKDLEPVRAYENGMQKLQDTLKNLDSDSPIWLNALLGRAFISIHSNPRIKMWIMENITRRMAHVHRNSTSFLGDIVIKDLDVGNSLPIISNPRLLDISNEGDMEIELDLDYTGGIAVEAATAASISVPAWTEYLRPINVPIVVRVSITSFSARVLLKVKPLWETNRIWFGFFRHPELKLELNLEPIISDKLVKIELVNQVIESRIKHALEEFVILPNMDSFVFWPFDDGLGEDFDSSDDEYFGQDMMSSELEENETDENETDDSEKLDSVLDLENIISSAHHISNEFDLQEDSYLSYVGDAAFELGKFIRDNRIDYATKEVVKKVSTNLGTYLGPTVSLLQDYSKPYRDLLLEETKVLGLDIVDRLGLTPDLKAHWDENIPKSPEKSATKKLSKASSRIIDLMGLKISTHPPEDTERDSPKRIRKRRMRKISSEPNLKENNFETSEIEPSEFESSAESTRLSTSLAKVRKIKSVMSVKNIIAPDEVKKSKLDEEIR